MSKTLYILLAIAGVILACVTSSYVSLYLYIAKQRQVTAQADSVAQAESKIVPHMQKYRFDIQCPDRSRVGYVSTKRLPQSVVCQDAE